MILGAEQDFREKTTVRELDEYQYFEGDIVNFNIWKVRFEHNLRVKCLPVVCGGGSIIIFPSLLYKYITFVLFLILT